MEEKILAVFVWLPARLERNNKFRFAGEQSGKENIRVKTLFFMFFGLFHLHIMEIILDNEVE